MNKLGRARPKLGTTPNDEREIECAEVSSHEKSSPKRDAQEKNISSKGSTAAIDPGLVDEDVLDSLTKECRWLHTCVKDEPANKPVKVVLNKTQFHYFEDTETWITKEDISDFLSKDKLPIVFLQAFMRLTSFLILLWFVFSNSMVFMFFSISLSHFATKLFVSALSLELDESDNGVKVGWLCPYEIHDQHCLKSLPDVKEYIHRAITEAMRSRRKFILAPYLEK